VQLIDHIQSIGAAPRMYEMCHHYVICTVTYTTTRYLTCLVTRSLLVCLVTRYHRVPQHPRCRRPLARFRPRDPSMALVLVHSMAQIHGPCRHCSLQRQHCPQHRLLHLVLLPRQHSPSPTVPPTTTDHVHSKRHSQGHSLVPLPHLDTLP
jgi:hypothetical protein